MCTDIVIELSRTKHITTQTGTSAGINQHTQAVVRYIRGVIGTQTVQQFCVRAQTASVAVTHSVGVDTLQRLQSKQYLFAIIVLYPENFFIFFHQSISVLSKNHFSGSLLGQIIKNVSQVVRTAGFIIIHSSLCTVSATRIRCQRYIIACQ